MTTYLIRRVLQSIVFLPLASLLIYTLLVMWMPSGPQSQYNYDKAILDRDAQSTDHSSDLAFIRADFADLEQRYKLNNPWPLNYFVWLFDPNDTSAKGYNSQNKPIVIQKGIDIGIGSFRLRGSGMLTGDFGTSTAYASGTAITTILASRWGGTFVLLAASFLIALLFGIPLGVIGAVKQRSPLDHTITFFSLAGLSIPSYVIGLLFIMFLAILPKSLHDQNGWDWLPWLPAGGMGNDDLWSRITHLALPALTLSLPQIAWVSRHTRFALLDVLSQDYIRTAWAKGLRSYKVIFKHALRNSLIPLITQVALLVPVLMSGAIVVETVFALQGVGKAFFRSIGGCLITYNSLLTDPAPCPLIGYFPIDYPLALTLLLIMLIIVAVANIVADALYAIVDPRINYESKGRTM
jgi:peptide/nickel transport system permease protein